MISRIYRCSKKRHDGYIAYRLCAYRLLTLLHFRIFFDYWKWSQRILLLPTITYHFKDVWHYYKYIYRNVCKLFVCNIIIYKLSFSLHTSAIINCETFIPKHFQCMISYALFIERIIFTLHMLKDPQCFASKHTYTIYHSVVKCGYYDLSNNFYGQTHIWRYSFTTSF